MIEPRLLQTLLGSIVTDELASIVMRLDAVVVKVVGSMVTESPLATSIAPLLVKVVGSMSREAVARLGVNRAAVGEGVGRR